LGLEINEVIKGITTVSMYQIQAKKSSVFYKMDYYLHLKDDIIALYEKSERGRK